MSGSAFEVPIRFGPAGWDYRDWAGVVYPKPRPKGFDPLRHLATYFDTVEVNTTFYRPAQAKVARDWASRVGDNAGFRFTAKLWRRFTHERTSAFSQVDVDAARAGFDALAEAGRLGAVLVQFPWSFRRTDENREWLEDVLRALDGLPRVVEVRHVSWEVPALFEELAARGVGFVNVDQPLFGKSIAPSAHVTAPVAYVRVHGRNYKSWFRKSATSAERYDYLYTADELAPWAERIAQMARDARARELYVVTNNHFRGQAPANALMLEAMVKGARVKAPEPLVKSFPEALSAFVEP